LTVRWTKLFDRSPSTAPRPQKEPRDAFNVFDPRAFSVLNDGSGDALCAWSVADAEETIEGAARLALGLLRSKPRLRRKFPRAISAGASGEYCDWLCNGGGTKLGLSGTVRGNVGAAFSAQIGRNVLELYLRAPTIQARYPNALLPAGQRKFVRWLLRDARSKHNLNVAEILWFLHETAEDIPEMLRKTWRINPAWQSRFPSGPASLGGAALDRWLRTEFPTCARLSRKAIARAAIPAGEQALLRQRADDDQIAFMGEGNRSAIHCGNGAAGKQNRGPFPGGVNVLSHFCYPSGIQQAAVFTCRALRAVGLGVSRRDVPTAPVFDVESRDPFLGLEVFPVTIINVAPRPYFVDAYHRSGLLRRSGIRRIAYWAWELDSIPTDWIELASLIDAIWAPTRFVAEAFRRHMPLPVHEVLPGVELGEIEPVEKAQLGIPAEHYVFLFMFDMCSQIERKNPIAVIRAFRAAFRRDDKATLVIKVSRGSSDPQGLAALRAAAAEAGVIVIDQVMSRAESYGLIDMCNCFVSLHRAEGFGLCLAEAMLMAKPVIATNYSGNLAFMDSENSLLVDCTLTETVPGNPIYKEGNHWAQPSEEHAAAHMRYCYSNREKAAALGAKGQGDAILKLSLEAAGSRMREKLCCLQT
jgi:glycosyltransferase involved in cell wall biosynthesis